jgi:hypothetical protein
VHLLLKENDEIFKEQVKENNGGTRFFITSIDSDLGLIEFKYKRSPVICDSISFYIYDIDKGMKYSNEISPSPVTGILSSPGELITV